MELICKLSSADLQAGCRVGLQAPTSPLAAWTPPVQPVYHPNEQKLFVGDPGLETGATRNVQSADRLLIRPRQRNLGAPSFPRFLRKGWETTISSNRAGSLIANQ